MFGALSALDVLGVGIKRRVRRNRRCRAGDDVARTEAPGCADQFGVRRGERVGVAQQ